MKLYSIPFCPYCFRVKITLKIKEISPSMVEIKEIDLKNPPEALKKINPNLTVPTLQLNNDSGFGESVTIMEYLDTLGTNKVMLFGKTPEHKAKLKFTMQYINEHITQQLNYAIMSKGSAIAYSKINTALPKAFELLNHLLQQQNGAPFFGGTTVNAQDVCLAPFVVYYNMVQKHTNLLPVPNEFQKVTQYFKNLEEHAVVKETMHQTQEMQDVILNFSTPPEYMLKIKNSSRTLIDNIQQETAKLNQTIQKLGSKILWEVQLNSKGPLLFTKILLQNPSESLKVLHKINDLQETTNHHCHFILENFTCIQVEVCTHEPQWGVSAMDFAFAEALAIIFLT
ncbi:glutathione S-transferase family protein [Spirobacillus cienkowskii]|uniref:glutathione S-transferase family protein n=1 Tax=Spirobacillus cienkowskii TaxID=495820 RepID=UPI0030CBC3E8